MARTWALVLAGGAGTRFGSAADGTAKVLAVVAGRTLAEWSLEAASSACDGVTLVLPSALAADWPDARVRNAATPDELATGGDTRSGSVRAGLCTVPGDVDVVVCHDAARPGAPAALFEAVIAAVRDGADAAVPALPVTDTLKRMTRRSFSSALGGAPTIGTVESTVSRDGLFAAQTPQAFRREALVAAHADDAESDGPEATDDAALIEAAGGLVVMVAGDPAAHKVTTPADLAIVEALLPSPQPPAA